MINKKKLHSWRSPVNRPILWLSLLLLGGLLPVAAGPLLHSDFSGYAEGDSGIRDSADRGQAISFRALGDDGKVPGLSSDRPESLSSRIPHSLRMDSSLIWYRNGENISMGPAFTLNVWLKPELLDVVDRRQAIVLRRDAWILENTVHGLIVRDLNGGSSALMDMPLSPYVWQMLTLVFEGKDVSFYIDGALIGNRQLEHELSDGRDLLIGTATSTGRYAYKGLLADFSIFPYPLDITDIVRLYQGINPLQIKR